LVSVITLVSTWLNIQHETQVSSLLLLPHSPLVCALLIINSSSEQNTKVTTKTCKAALADAIVHVFCDSCSAILNGNLISSPLLIFHDLRHESTTFGDVSKFMDFFFTHMGFDCFPRLLSLSAKLPPSPIMPPEGQSSIENDCDSSWPQVVSVEMCVNDDGYSI
jgi:hypothetical protein